MKRTLIVATIAMIIAVVATVFFIRNIRHKQTPGLREQIRDSIRISKEKQQLHSDSAKFWNEKLTELTIQSDSVNHLDSTGRAALRARYRAGLREQIRAELARQPH